MAESYRAPVSATARRNGLSASQLFTWRRLAREGRLSESPEPTKFAPAVVTDASLLSSPVSAPEQIKVEETPPSVAPGRIDIVLNCGHRVIVETGADATVARLSGACQFRPPPPSRDVAHRMAMAFFCPTSTTSRFPLVTPV